MSTGGFSNPVAGGGGTLIRSAIHSPNFVSGSTGWNIAQDGSAEFNNVTIRGTFSVPSEYQARSSDMVVEPPYNVTSTFVEFNSSSEWVNVLLKTYSNNMLVTVGFDGYNNNTAVSTLRIAHNVYSGPTIAGPWTLEWSASQADGATVTNSGAAAVATHQGFAQTVFNGITSNLTARPWINVVPAWRVSSGGPATCKIFNARLCVVPSF